MRRKSPMWSGRDRQRQARAELAASPPRPIWTARRRVRFQIPLRRKDALTFTGYYLPLSPHGWVQNRVGILTVFIYAAITAQGGYKMLFGSEHLTEAGRRRTRAPREASKRLPVLRLDPGVFTNLWHGGCVAESPNGVVGASVVWGHGDGSSRGNMRPMSPL